jgi:hypothetical protein
MSFSLLSAFARPFFSHLFNRNHPISYLSSVSNPLAVSDFFAWSHRFANIHFATENVYALLIGRKVPVSHVFTFFSTDGRQLCQTSAIDDNFFYACDLELPAYPSNSYSSFTHHLLFDVDHSSLYPELTPLPVIVPQSRSYVTYSTPFASPLGSTVHGNFGQYAHRFGPISLRRQDFIYHIPYLFCKHQYYDLVFMNPLLKPLTITLRSVQCNFHFEAILPPLGTHALELTRFSGILQVIAPLPICRPIIFVNSLQSTSAFDVFHS